MIGSAKTGWGGSGVLGIVLEALRDEIEAEAADFERRMLWGDPNAARPTYVGVLDASRANVICNGYPGGSQFGRWCDDCDGGPGEHERGCRWWRAP